MGKSNKKKEKLIRINVLRKQYDAFIEEDKKRKERNEYILGRLDKMRNVSLALRNRFNIISSNPLPKIIKYRGENSNQNQMLPQLTSITSGLQERDICSVISNNVDENFVLTEISKKYILIPKLNTLSIENVECAHTNENTDDADWTSKYNILNQLKKCEKENLECINTEKTHQKKTFEENNNDDDKDIDTSQHEGIVNTTDENISYVPRVDSVHSKELMLNNDTIKHHNIDNKLKNIRLEPNVQIMTKATKDNKSDDKVNNSKELRREVGFVNNLPQLPNKQEIQEGQRINRITQDVNKAILDTAEFKKYSCNEMESKGVTNVINDTDTENITKQNGAALLLNNGGNVQEILSDMLNDEIVKSDDTLKDKDVVDENYDYTHNQSQIVQQEYPTYDYDSNMDPSISIAAYEAQDYSVENTKQHQPSYAEEVHPEHEPSAMFAQNIDQYNVAEQPVANEYSEQADTYANYEQIQAVTTEYVEQPEMYALNTNQQDELGQYEPPAYKEQPESNVQNTEQHGESNSQAELTEFTGQPEDYAVDTDQHEGIDQYGSPEYTDQSETYMHNTEIELEHAEKTEFTGQPEMYVGQPEMYAENIEHNVETNITETNVYEGNNQPYLSTNNIGHEDDSTGQQYDQNEEPLQQFDPNYEQQYLENTYEHQQYDQKQYDENYAHQAYDGNIKEPINDESITNTVTEDTT